MQAMGGRGQDSKVNLRAPSGGSASWKESRRGRP